MKPLPYKFPGGDSKKVDLPFSLESLHALICAIDPEGARLYLRYLAQGLIDEEGEALALTQHQDSKATMVQVFEEMRDKCLDPSVNPLILLARIMEKGRPK